MSRKYSVSLANQTNFVLEELISPIEQQCIYHIYYYMSMFIYISICIRVFPGKGDGWDPLALPENLQKFYSPRPTHLSRVK